MRIASTLSLVVLLPLVACDGKKSDSLEAGGLPKATIAEPQAPQTSAGAPHTFSNDGSTIRYVGKKVTGAHTGDFQRFTGEVKLGADPASSSVAVTIDMGSVTSDSEKLTGHLKSPDFFDTAQFPTATFQSSSVVAGGAGGSHTVSGVMDLHGVKKQLTFPATIAAAGDTVTVNAAFSFNRKAFGINYPGKANDLISDDVELTLAVVAKKAVAAVPATPDAAAAPTPTPTPEQ